MKGTVAGMSHELIADTELAAWSCLVDEASPAPRVGDEEFIAISRAALPRLVAEVRWLRMCYEKACCTIDRLREAKGTIALPRQRITDREAVCDALRALVAVLKRVEEPLDRSILIATTHGFPYTGPNWGEELSQAEAVLAKL